jgi:hypothetical protein
VRLNRNTLSYPTRQGFAPEKTARQTGLGPLPDLPPAQVQSVVINDGSARRSMVDTIRVTFSTQVDLAAGGFTLAWHQPARVVGQV